MNVWKLGGADNLVRAEAPTPTPPEDGRLRVRITKVFLCGADADMYAGKFRVRYPIIPGRYAVGFILDENPNPLFPKGTRVLLHTFRREPYTGTAKKDFSEDEIDVCGLTRDGFLADFALVSPSEMTPIPEGVNDERGLVAHYIALAKTALEKIGVQRGQHIAVVGANLFGILLCQLLIYQQAAPILIDADPARLDFAQSCGVYYTLTIDDALLNNVAKITGGRLAAGAVYVASAAGNDTNIPFLVSAAGTNTVICGFVPMGVTFDLAVALRKQITLRFAWRCQVLETAFNLLNVGAVDTSHFEARYMKPDDVSTFLKEYKDHPERDVCEINIVKLV